MSATTVTYITVKNKRVRMLRTFKRLVADQSGATAIEYGLICAMISMILIIAFNVGDSLIASLQLLVSALR
jgi:Flp pilus assembly pilin Flp